MRDYSGSVSPEAADQGGEIRPRGDQQGKTRTQNLETTNPGIMELGKEEPSFP
jgi:hypothetical protein